MAFTYLQDFLNGDRLTDRDIIYESVNEKGINEIKDGSFVRFRCMIQDNGFNPQIINKSNSFITPYIH